MNAIQIIMPVTPYKTSQAEIDALVNLSAPALLINRAMHHEYVRTDLVREALPTRTFLNWAHTFEGEAEVMYVQGIYSRDTLNALEDLRARGIITYYQEAKIK